MIIVASIRSINNNRTAGIQYNLFMLQTSSAPEIDKGKKVKIMKNVTL